MASGGECTLAEPRLARRVAGISGAVGVGIGFGLQKVVSNFISGVIILADRSIKPGDTIELGDTFAGGNQRANDRPQDVGDLDGDDGRATKYPKVSDGSGSPIRNMHGKVQGGGPGWPLAKSLTGIPTLYPWSLAYGRNLLTGTDSPAGQWRIRNMIVWARPNPPVGALGDKFRPATSYITVACKSAKRYFDLDAVPDAVLRNDRHRLRRRFDGSGFDRQIGVERELLGHVADSGPEALRVLRHICSQHLRRAGRRSQEPTQHPDCCRLTTAVRTEKAIDTGLRNLELDAVDCRQGAKLAR